MKPSRDYLIKVLAAGFIVLLLLATLLFWARMSCETALRHLMELMSWETRHANIETSRLMPEEIEKDPNVARHSYVRAGFQPSDAPAAALGIIDYFTARAPRGRRSNVFYSLYEDEHNNALLYFDRKSGLIIHHRTYEQRKPDKTTVLKTVHLYAGPEGVSRTPDKTLGRFSHPLTNVEGYWRPVVLFDKKLHRFFRIDLKEKTVAKGPKLGKDGAHNPVQIDRLTKIWPGPSLEWQPPMTKIPPSPADEDENRNSRSRKLKQSEFKPIIENFYWDLSGQYLLVLDKSGRIDLLDRETLQFAGTAGYLPAPHKYKARRSTTSIKPKDLLGYTVLPIVLCSDGTDMDYRGMAVAGVSREGTDMALAVFDKTGRLITSRHTFAEDRLGRDVPSGEAIYFAEPWAPTLTIAKYLLENLHPPILSAASFLTADSFEAAAGHRALFLLPNSFIAMKARQFTRDASDRYYGAILLIMPSIILGIFLAWRIARDATLVGLSENARLCWIIGAIAFGPSAYITYRLTRPKITLVTCLNCGRLRRPDMANCHHCRGKWLVPELTPPRWRVTD